MGRKILRGIAILIIIVLIAIIGFMLYYGQKDLLAAVEPTSDEEITVAIEDNSTASDVILQLANDGIINDYQATLEYCIEIDCVVYPGNYNISKSMRADEIVDYLQDSQNIIEGEQLLITEGAMIEDIATNLEAVSNYSYDEIIAYWSNTDNLNNYISNYWYLTEEILSDEIKYPLEGYFPAATYPIEEGDSLEDITVMMLDHGLDFFADYQNMETMNNFSFHEMLTMASIIERETIFDEDKPKVASVFYNRIDNTAEYGYLQSDITVLYALGEHKEQVLYVDLEIDDPYNTYLYPGLTPGPIASPSIQSIDAAYNPADTDYYFFYADSEGKVYYTETYDEHTDVVNEDRAE